MSKEVTSFSHPWPLFALILRRIARYAPTYQNKNRLKAATPAFNVFCGMGSKS